MAPQPLHCAGRIFKTWRHRNVSAWALSDPSERLFQVFSSCCRRRGRSDRCAFHRLLSSAKHVGHATAQGQRGRLTLALAVRPEPDAKPCALLLSPSPKPRPPATHHLRRAQAGSKNVSDHMRADSASLPPVARIHGPLDCCIISRPGVSSGWRD